MNSSLECESSSDLNYEILDAAEDSSQDLGWNSPRKIHFIQLETCSGYGISSYILEICDRWSELGVPVELWALAVDEELSRSYLKGIYPHVAMRAYHRLFAKMGYEAVCHLAERYLVHTINSGDVAYIWPDCSTWLLKALKAKNCTVVLERINAPMVEARQVLRNVGMQLDGDDSCRISKLKAQEESQQLDAADYLFICSPFNYKGFMRMGVTEHKLLNTTYAWSPKSFHPQKYTKPSEEGEQIRFLFCGSEGLRKGVPQLLQYWLKAAVKGKLLLVGMNDERVRKHCARELADPSIEVVGYTKNLSKVYGEADVFIMVSHTEGSPIVTYLALAAGLPCLVSEAAGSHIVRDGVDGWIMETFDEQKWVNAIRKIAEQHELRKKMSDSAKNRALQYTWQKVADRRLLKLKKVLGV